MNAMANRSYARRTNPADKARRQKIILGVLAGVLVLLLVWQGSKLLGGGSGDETKASSDSAAASSSATAESASSASAVTPAASAAIAAQERKNGKWIKHLPARDPFVALAGTAAGSAAAAKAAAQEAAAATPAPPPKPIVKTVPAKVVATTAVLLTNGGRHVVRVGQTFKLGDASFKLLSLNKKNAKIGVVLGTFKGGTGQVALQKGKQVTIENTVTGVKYDLTYKLALSAVPGGN